MTDEPGSPLLRMRCCVCGDGDMDYAVDYLEMTLRTEFSTAEQRFGVHAACLSTVLSPGFRIEIIGD